MSPTRPPPRGGRDTPLDRWAWGEMEMETGKEKGKGKGKEKEKVEKDVWMRMNTYLQRVVEMCMILCA